MVTRMPQLAGHGGSGLGMYTHQWVGRTSASWVLLYHGSAGMQPESRVCLLSSPPGVGGSQKNKLSRAPGQREQIVVSGGCVWTRNQQDANWDWLHRERQRSSLHAGSWEQEIQEETGAGYPWKGGSEGRGGPSLNAAQAPTGCMLGTFLQSGLFVERNQMVADQTMRFLFQM